MTRFVIGPDVALAMARDRIPAPTGHQLLAPASLRSQVLAELYRSVRAGECTTADAERRLDHIRSLRLRLLGDRVLQAQAWRYAERLGWPDTWTAEYVALTTLQADAFVTLDPALERAVHGVVPTAPASLLGLTA